MVVIKSKKRISLIRERRRRALIFHGSLIIGLSVLFFTASIVCSWLNYFQIQNIEVMGNRVVWSESIISASRVTLANNYAWIWPRSFFLWYPKKQIVSDLLQQFPRIKNVAVGLSGKNSIIINIEERKPYGAWCENKKAFKTNESEKCFVLDRNGFIFDRAPDFSGHLFWHFYGKLNEPGNIGAHYLIPDIFVALANFIDGISDRGFDVVAIESFFDEGYYKIYLANDIYLLISNSQSLDLTIRNLEALTKEKDMDLRNPDVLSRLEYVDLRFGNKINYKEKLSDKVSQTK